ncbi:MAG: radical SAM protein [Phycisphaerae bacterium]|nr:radical SAM protein [Phycisphaerae bacterium]
MEASIIVTYRCPMQCTMCNVWANPTKEEEEFKPDLLRKLPPVGLVNVTGGEPTIRDDLDEIIGILLTKTDRVVVSTSGWFEDRVVGLARKHPRLGFRVSIEGLSQRNDELRGRPGGFDRGLRVLLGLRRMGVKDIGFGITVSNSNSADMLSLYDLARELKLQFATAAFHNSFYFHKDDNVITNLDEVTANFEELINRLMREGHPKSWFRAFFNMGLVNYIHGKPRLLPCEAGSENFFIDPYGNVLPCNGMERKHWYDTMGNLHEVQDFMEIWNGPKAREVRQKVRRCPKNCWMIGSASPVMKKYIRQVAMWVIKNKIRTMRGQRIKTACLPVLNIPPCDSH